MPTLAASHERRISATQLRPHSNTNFLLQGALWDRRFRHGIQHHSRPSSCNCRGQLRRSHSWRVQSRPLDRFSSLSSTVGSVWSRIVMSRAVPASAQDDIDEVSWHPSAPDSARSVPGTGYPAETAFRSRIGKWSLRRISGLCGT